VSWGAAVGLKQASQQHFLYCGVLGADWPKNRTNTPLHCVIDFWRQAFPQGKTNGKKMRGTEVFRRRRTRDEVGTNHDTGWRRYAQWGAATGVYTYLVLLLCAWMLMRLVGDDWWFSTLLVMGPRWIYGLPLIILVPLAVLWRRRWLVPLTLAGAILLWPLMGLNTPLRAWHPSEPPALRVLSYNINRWAVKDDRFVEFALQLNPDLIAIQECPSRQWKMPDGWYVERAQELIVGSRYPILRVEKSISNWPSKRAFINGLYCVVDTPDGKIGFACIHLETPRPALQLILDPKEVFDLDNVAAAEQLLEYRKRESAYLANWLKQFPEPKIIAGDFNMPVSSTIYTKYWSDFENAFSRTGFGFGYTKRTKIEMFRFGLRIDHIISSPPLQATDCRVGPDLGSDHQPVIAQFSLR